MPLGCDVAGLQSPPGFIDIDFTFADFTGCNSPEWNLQSQLDGRRRQSLGPISDPILTLYRVIAILYCWPSTWNHRILYGRTWKRCLLLFLSIRIIPLQIECERRVPWGMSAISADVTAAIYMAHATIH